jgi:hypothetical protein
MCFKHVDIPVCTVCGHENKPLEAYTTPCETAEAHAIDKEKKRCSIVVFVKNKREFDCRKHHEEKLKAVAEERVAKAKKDKEDKKKQ